MRRYTTNWELIILAVLALVWCGAWFGSPIWEWRSTWLSRLLVRLAVVIGGPVGFWLIYRWFQM